MQRFCHQLWLTKAEHDIASYTLISLFMTLTVLTALSNLTV